MDLGESFDFNTDSLPVPSIDSLQTRGENTKMLQCGATCSVALTDGDVASLSAAENLQAYVDVSATIIAEKDTFIVQRTSLAAQIAQRLEERNVPVEELRKDASPVPLRENEYASRRLGRRDIQKALSTTSDPEARRDVLTAFGDTLGRIHEAGVAYGNNHLGNMIVGEDGRVSFIDFKTARMVEVDWAQATAEQLFKTFGVDLSLLTVANLSSIGCTRDEQRIAVEAAVSEYPVPNEIRAELIQRSMPEDQSGKLH